VSDEIRAKSIATFASEADELVDHKVRRRGVDQLVGEDVEVDEECHGRCVSSNRHLVGVDVLSCSGRPLIHDVCLDSLFQIFCAEVQTMYIHGENAWIIINQPTRLVGFRPLRRPSSAEEFGALSDQVSVNSEAFPVWLLADINNECCVEIDPVIWPSLVGCSIMMGPGVTYLMRFAGGGSSGALPSLGGLGTSSFDIVAPGIAVFACG
jgi:hypothetical protein